MKYGCPIFSVIPYLSIPRLSVTTVTSMAGHQTVVCACFESTMVFTNTGGVNSRLPQVMYSDRFNIILINSFASGFRYTKACFGRLVYLDYIRLNCSIFFSSFSSILHCNLPHLFELYSLNGWGYHIFRLILSIHVKLLLTFQCHFHNSP